ncbi:MAG: 6-phosphofructokinase [Saprospiraceae bacterium]|jgi:6-phosphofructokinase 1|nr:6-phosphofructokinase [Saprospiraceae bacterium]MBK7797260.1 6-phosphofructokinase [Saprospiraceae bacterium]MBL0261645.1 6-phosphofructokinase [Saprospiraceae bacterium]
MQDIKRIAVFTSGGDAPGMNAAVRAIIRTASFHDLHVYGIQRGYEGMIDGEIDRLEISDSANIIQRGGTFLKTARSQRFMTVEGRQAAYANLVEHDIDALVAIGGNGTFAGALQFNKEFKMPIIGLPGTIDNDLYGTDFTIGFDTAVNTAIEAVDKIRDTADSHNRLFLIEVMGRHSGFIAVYTAICSGASAFLVPEVETNIDGLIEKLKKSLRRKKLFGLVIVAEGNHIGNSMEIAKLIQERTTEYDLRVTMLGHLQRGGSPSAADRLLASRLGYEAVTALMQGKQNVMVGIVHQNVEFTPFSKAIKSKKEPDDHLIEITEILGM